MKQKKNKRGIGRKGRTQIIPLCRHLDPAFKGLHRLRQKTPRTIKAKWQDTRAAHKSSSLSACQKLAEKEIRGNPIHNSSKEEAKTSRQNQLGISLTQKVEDIYSETCDTRETNWRTLTDGEVAHTLGLEN